MKDFDWVNRNEYHVCFQDSKIVNANSCINGYICFTIAELKRLQTAINETLKAYNRLGWSEDDIKERNNSLINSFWQEMRQPSKERKPRGKKVSKDYLYLIHDTIQNTLKIGITRNPKNRFRNIQLATSNKLKMLYAIKGKAHLEKELQKSLPK
jgi:hypothetical protein